MSVQKYVQQVRKRQTITESKIDKIQDFYEGAENLPIDIFRGLEYSISSKLSSSKRDVIIVRSEDRETDRDGDRQTDRQSLTANSFLILPISNTSHF